MRVPRLCLHKATGQAVVRLGGKDYYCGRYGTREAEARYRGLIASWLREPGQAPPPPAPGRGVRVAGLLTRYLTHAETYYRKGGKPTRQLSRIKAAFRPLAERFPRLPAAEFGPAQLRAVREDMVALGWSRNFINAAVGMVRRAWRWACEEELVPPHLWQALASVKNLERGRSAARETEGVRPVEWAVVEKTLPHLPPVVADMVRVQYLTAMRPCEVCHLRGRDIDRTGLLPEGVRVEGVWVYHVPPEGNKLAHKDVKRAVVLGTRAREILAPYLERRDPDGAVFSPRETLAWWARVNDRRPRFYAGADRYSTHGYDQCLRRACARHGIPHWSPNQLRHLRLSEFRGTAEFGAASSGAGHESLETSLIYARRRLEGWAEVMRRLG